MNKYIPWAAVLPVVIVMAWVYHGAVFAEDYSTYTGNQNILNGGLTSLTSSYVESTRFADIGNFNNANIRIQVKTASENVGETCSIKYRWSQDATNWVDECVLVAATAASGEQTYTNLARVVRINLNSSSTDVNQMNSANAFCERLNRLARFFRVAYKSSSPSSNGKVEMILYNMKN